jgi:hypothetical protein
MQQLHFFYRQELPFPSSSGNANSKATTRYPACEWRPSEATDALEIDRHPMNRFLCSWLTSDMAEVDKCDEALSAMDALLKHDDAQWFADGHAFLVDFKTTGVQFNQSNVTPDDVDWWNQPEGQFTLQQVQDALRQWRDFLTQPQ